MLKYLFIASLWVQDTGVFYGSQEWSFFAKVMASLIGWAQT